MKPSEEIKTIAPTILATLTGLAVEGATGIVLGGLIASLASLHSQRAIELIERSFSCFDVEKLDKNFLNSAEFLEIFQRSIEIVTKTASDKKRKLVADYLSGVIENSVINDIHGQLLEDLNNLQEFHLQVIAALPDEANKMVSREKLPAILSNMEKYIYKKAISDLEHLGFLEYISLADGGEHRFTTEYLVKFKKTFKPQ